MIKSLIATVFIIAIGLFAAPIIAAKFSHKIVVGRDYYYEGEKYGTLPSECSSTESDENGSIVVNFECPDGNNTVFVNGVKIEALRSK